MAKLLSLKYAIRNNSCRSCTARIILKNLTIPERSRFFAAGFCPSCYEAIHQYQNSGQQLTLMEW